MNAEFAAYVPPPRTIARSLIGACYGFAQPVINPQPSPQLDYVPLSKPLATIKRRISAITAAGILKGLYPRRAPTRRLRWICANVCFQARCERIAKRTPAKP